MAARVQEHVGERVPDLARRAEEAGVKPLGEHRAAARERPVQRTCDAGADGHHPASERRRVRRFDEEVRVRALEAVVHDAEVAAVTDGDQAALERADELDGAQRGEAATKLDRHVRGKAGGDASARAVRNARLGAGLASGAGAAAAPSAASVQLETELRGMLVHRELE